MFDVDPSIKKHLEGAGKVVRWINATKFKAAGGFNKGGWQPVRVSDLPKEVIEGTGVAYGSTAEGFLVRNDMMLAQRSKELAARHENSLRQSADRAARKTKGNAQAIKESLGGYGRVIEGYEENGEE